MHHVFISYKREERHRARQLADALQAQGLTVWWDPSLRAGERYDDVIENTIKECACVVVLWSKAAVASTYVKDEASLALESAKLVPVTLDDVSPPFRFRALHTHSLSNWNGESDAPDLQPLFRDIFTHVELSSTTQRSSNVDIEEEFQSHVEWNESKFGSSQKTSDFQSPAVPVAADPFLEPVLGLVLGKITRRELNAVSGMKESTLAALLNEESDSPVHVHFLDDDSFDHYFVNPGNLMDVGLRIDLKSMSLAQFSRTLVMHGYQIRPNEIKRARQWFEFWNSSRYTTLNASKVLGLSGAVIVSATYRASNLDDLEKASALLYYTVTFHAGELSPHMLELFLR